jgi:hypothetical protein
MQASLEAIKTATRVLSALTDKKSPSHADVRALRDFTVRTFIHSAPL